MASFRLVPVLLSLVAVTLSTACAEPSALDVLADATASRMTPAQLQHRMIAYAGSLEGSSDISEERFTSTFGVTLTPVTPGSTGGFSEGQPLTDGYMFYASIVPLPAGNSFATQEIGLLQPGKKALTDDPNAACFWEASSAGKQLEAQGYQRGGERPFQRGRLQQFWRPIGEGKQVFTVDLLTYALVNPVPQTCVYAVQYSGGDQ